MQMKTDAIIWVVWAITMPEFFNFLYLCYKMKTNFQ